MKNIKRFAAFALCACVALFSGCKDNGDEKKEIAVIVKATDSDFWHGVKSGVDAAATEYNVSVTFEGPRNEEDYSAQNKLIEDAVKSGAGAIVLSAIDYKNNADAVNKAVRAGTKVVTIDSNVDSNLVSMFIGTDNEEAGKAAAAAAISGFAPESEIRIGLVNYYKSTDNGMRREQGFRDYIDSVSNAAVSAAVNVDGNIQSATDGAAALMHDHPEINVLVGFNEWTTLGVGNTVKNLGLTDCVRAVGFDTNTASLEMLEAGIMDALIVQNPFAIGYLGVQNAEKLLSDNSAENQNIYTAVTTVTKDNMFDKDIQKLIFRQD